MKLLITGDWHYRSQNPIARLDDFQAALESKLLEVADLAARHDAEAILQTGDVFDSPSPAYSTLTSLERLLRTMDLPVWTVPGNHDEFGHSLESLDRTAYGHLAETKAIRDLPSDPVDNGLVEITGTGFSTTTDDDVSDYLVRGKRLVQIHVAHGMLLERTPRFEIKHTLLADVAMHPDCPEVLIVGHEHMGFGVKRLPRAKGGDLVVINPGALARLSAHPGEIERTIQVCLLEVYPGTGPACPRCGAKVELESVEIPWQECPECGEPYCVDLSTYGPPEMWNIGSPIIETTLIPLECARPGYEVLGREHIEQIADRDAKMSEFLGLLAQEGEAKFLDIQAIVEGIAKSENLPVAVVDEALRRIAEARETLGGKAV